MTKVSKNAKILLTLTLLVLAFCCSFTVTTAYFTASSTRSGTLKFPNLEVKFQAINSDGDIADESQTIELYPMTGAIIRGQAFSLSLESSGTQTAIGNIAIHNTANSIEAFVRFWIDAYIVTNEETGEIDTTTNYGEYFLLDLEKEEINTYIARGESAGDNVTEGSWCYYVNNYMNPNGSGKDRITVYLGNTLELSETTSDEIFSELVGHKLKISINLEAVQRANSAFSSAFNDEKGYYSGWQKD